MEQTIRLLEIEIQNQKTNLKALEFDKTSSLNEAMFKQQQINDNSQKLKNIERELNSLYVKFPDIEKPNIDSSCSPHAKTAYSPKKVRKNYDFDLDED